MYAVNNMERETTW